MTESHYIRDTGSVGEEKSVLETVVMAIVWKYVTESYLPK